MWGLASHPTQELFATTSDDQTIRVWDAPSKVSTVIQDMRCTSQKDSLFSILK